MAKIKHTKNELKAQKEALTRYERFLPMLQLKKQQLQAEMQAIDAHIKQALAEKEKLRASLDSWIELFSEPIDIAPMLTVREIRIKENNIAGLNIPVFDEVIFDRAEIDLFATPYWIDPGLDILEELIRLRAKALTLEEQMRLIGEELRITNQRVNLFEKVKIPECKENIRVIKIFLGDEQTAGVVRAKIAKSRTMEYEYSDEAA